MPSNQSAILVEDFKTVKKLAEYIKRLNKDDEEYETIGQLAEKNQLNN